MIVRLPAAARRRQLLDVALETFAAQGFHNTSMNEIAEAAGVTKPVLYQHFGSKQDLYLELLDDVGSRLLDDITKATASADTPRAQVELGLQAYFGFVANERSAFTLLFGSGARQEEVFAHAVRRVEASIAEAIAPLIAADLDVVHRRVLAHALVGMAEATSRHWVDGDLALDPEALGNQLADLAWGGLRSVRPR